MAGITAPDRLGERVVICRNPDLAGEHAPKREHMLAAAERDLARIQAAAARKRGPLPGAAEIGLAAGAVINADWMAQHFALAITDASCGIARNAEAIAAKGAADGLCVVRTQPAS
jgi:hypothetical protein